MKNLKIAQILFGLIATALVSNANAALPIWEEIVSFNTMEADSETPNLQDKQTYLEDAPTGISAKHAWTIPGGKGENVKIIDIEIGYDDKHEDFPQLFFSQGNFKSIDKNHGTGVLGVISGMLNSFGIKGIAHMAKIGFHGFEEGAQDNVDQNYIDGITNAIRNAANQLEAGDVLIIEQHMNGPDDSNYTAVEYWDPIFAELKKVTDKGIHCIEAAGNGGSNFDDPSYNGAFDLTKRDSGCVVVGAGSVATKERLSFSNYGSRLDAFGYGELVTTTGYGDLFNGGSNRIYTRRFNGTSSATPIVAGAVAVVSSIAKAQGTTIDPFQMRATLRATGTPQGEKTKSKRIGNLPDIKAMLNHLDLD